MQNKIDHANRILRLMDRYPNMTVEELFYLIACRIEGEKFVISSYRWSVPMLQETYDNRDNLERLQYLVWDAGVKHNGKINTIFYTYIYSRSLKSPLRDNQRVVKEKIVLATDENMSSRGRMGSSIISSILVSFYCLKVEIVLTKFWPFVHSLKTLMDLREKY